MESTTLRKDDGTQVRLLGAETVISDYVKRPEIERQIQEAVRHLSNASDLRILLVHGDGGVDKTTLLRHALDAPFLAKCGFALRIWLNVYEISNSTKEAAETKFLESLSTLLEIHTDDITSAITSIRRRLSDVTAIGGKVLLLLDEAFNEAIFKFVGYITSDNIRTICVSRLNFAESLPRRFVKPPIHVTEMPQATIMEMFLSCKEIVDAATLKKLVKLCQGLPLLVQVIRCGLLAAQQTGIVQQYVNQLESNYPHALIGGKMSSDSSDSKKEETIWKLLLIGFHSETTQFRRKYYAFLLFDEGSDVAVEDLAILWQCNVHEASEFCQQLSNRSLIRSNEDHSRFNMHAYLFGAALEFAISSETSNTDITKGLRRSQQTRRDILARLRRNLLFSTMNPSLQENAFHLAIKRRREKLVHAILVAMRHPKGDVLLTYLNSQLDQELNLPLHLLLETQWMVGKRDFGLETACFLADHLLVRNRSRAEELLLLAKNKKGKTVLDLLLVNLEKSNKTKWHLNALLLSAGHDYRALMKFLLMENGVRKDYVDENGNNVVLIAIQKWQDPLFLVQVFQVDINWCNNDGFSALMIASSSGLEHYVEMLLQQRNSIKVDLKSNSGYTALMLAARDGHLQVVTCLIQQGGADVHLKDNCGDSALSLALLNNQIATAQFIYENGGRLRPGEMAVLSIRARYMKHRQVSQMLTEWMSQMEGFDEHAKPNYDIVREPLCRLLEIEIPPLGSPSDNFFRYLYAEDIAAASKESLQLGEDGQEICKTAAQIFTFLGTISAVEFLLNEMGVDPNSCVKEGVTLLMTAASNAVPGLVRLLLAKNADVNAKNEAEESALWQACENGHEEVVKLLIAHKANVGDKMSNGVTVLHVASEKGHIEVVAILIKHIDVNASSLHDMTPLWLATMFGHLEVVQLLIAHKADTNVSVEGGLTPLWWACSKGHVELAKLLLMNGADPNVRTAEDDRTPIMAAIEEGHLEVMKTLLAHNADINAKTKRNSTLLWLASQSGRLEIVKELIARNADVNAKNVANSTPLIVASQNGHLEVVESLIAHGADLEVKTLEGGTALYFASQSGHAEIVRKLLLHKANGNFKSGNGVTPLITASYMGHTGAVKVLLECEQVDRNAVDSAGMTAYKLAVMLGHTEIIAFFQQPRVAVSRWQKLTPRNVLISLALVVGFASMWKFVLPNFRGRFVPRV